MLYKYRDVYHNGAKVTTIGLKLWWKWAPLLEGFTYGRTRLWRGYDV